VDEENRNAEQELGLQLTEDGAFRVMTRRDALKAVAILAGTVAGAPAVLGDLAQAAVRQAGAKRGGTLTFAVDGLTGNLDPGIYTTFGGIMGTNLVGKCLTFEPYHTWTGARPRPALATSWEHSKDFRTYRFHLRRGVKFHDGNTLTAHDCVRSFTRLMNAKDPSRPPGTYAIVEIGGSNIKSVRAIGDHEFEVRLGVADVVLPVRFGRYNSTILSAAAIEKYGKDIGTKMITAGPFRTAEYVPNQGMRFRAFQNYYEGKPLLDEVFLQIIPDSATLSSSLRNGSLDASSFVAFSDLPTFKKDSRFVVDTPPPIICFFLGQNLRSPVLSDIRVRQAINYAIDRQAINQAALFGYGYNPKQLAGYIPPPVLGHDPSLRSYSTQNLDKARALLAQVGKVPTIRFHTSNVGIWPRAGQVIVENLKAIGFSIQAEYVDPGTDTARIFDPKGHDLFLNNRGGALADPDSWATTNESTSGIWDAWWGVPTVLPNLQKRLDKIIFQARQISDPAKRERLYRAYQQILMKEVVGITVLAYHPQVTVKSTKVKNLDGTALDAWALYAQKTSLA
jgi:ABC-type transport system substrate-binding protein